MKAVVQRGYGPAAEVLRVEEIDPPTPAGHEVLVRVHAAAVHADVWHVVTGLPYILRLASGLRRPRNPVPGIDVAGVVEAIGHGVTRFRTGDAVFGETVGGFQWKNGGAFAELAAVPEKDLERKPEAVTFEQAASIPTSGLIALLNLRSAGRERAGGRVLINGAAGSVGSAALQICKAWGAEVTAVDAGEEKLTLLRSLGADHVLDYTVDDVLGGDARYDLVYDVASVLDLTAVKRVLRPGGRYVIIGHMHYVEDRHRWFGNLPGFFRVVLRGAFDDALANPGAPDAEGVLAELRQLMDDGLLTPVVGRSFGLQEVPEAIAALRSGKVVGRIVVTL